MHLSPRVLLLSVCGLLAGCGELRLDRLFFLEVVQEEVCKKEEVLALPGAPLGVMEVLHVMPFDVPDPGVEEGDGEVVLRLTKATLSSPEDPSRLDLLESVTLTLRPEGSTGAAHTRHLLRFTRAPGSLGQPIRLHGEEVDFAALAGTRVELVLHAKGEFPRERWSVHLEACGSLRVRINYLARLL